VAGLRRPHTRSRNLLVPMLAALLCAVGGALAIGAFVLGNNSPENVATTPAPLPVVDVLIPLENIQIGAELQPTLFRRESRDKANFAGVNLIGNFEQLKGLYAKAFIPLGQPLVAEQVTSKAPINSVVPKIRPGFRAITLTLDRETTNEGWTRAGVRVDVVVIIGLGQKASVAMIAQNLRVLSSGTSVSSEFGGESKTVSGGESTVTLEVSAEDQKRLKLASGQGSLRLLLRGDEDTAELEAIEPLPLESVLGVVNETPNAGPPDHGWVVIDGRRYRVVGATLLPE
jgi:Flp pilus assembly protein CpaB